MQFVRKENRLSRDSYFSGVAWMMVREDWKALDAVWPTNDVLSAHGWVRWVNDKVGVCVSQ